jgi:hypothetical protein
MPLHVVLIKIVNFMTRINNKLQDKGTVLHNSLQMYLSKWASYPKSRSYSWTRHGWVFLLILLSFLLLAKCEQQGARSNTVEEKQALLDLALRNPVTKTPIS